MDIFKVLKYPVLYFGMSLSMVMNLKILAFEYALQDFFIKKSHFYVKMKKV